MASLTQWTWVWVNSRSWWWTGRPGVLQLQRPWGCKELDTTEQLNWTESFLFGQYCEFLQLLYCLIKRLCSYSQNTTPWVPLKCQFPWITSWRRRKMADWTHRWNPITETSRETVCLLIILKCYIVESNFLRKFKHHNHSKEMVFLSRLNVINLPSNAQTTAPVFFQNMGNVEWMKSNAFAISPLSFARIRDITPFILSAIKHLCFYFPPSLFSVALELFPPWPVSVSVLPLVL